MMASSPSLDLKLVQGRVLPLVESGLEPKRAKAHLHAFDPYLCRLPVWRHGPEYSTRVNAEAEVTPQKHGLVVTSQ